MLADARGGLRLIASSDERMRLLELFELQGAQGPCLDAFSSGRAVQANAVDSLARWPVFAPQASGEGFQVMCAVPLRVRTDVIGALNLSAAATSRSPVPRWRSRRPWRRWLLSG